MDGDELTLRVAALERAVLALSVALALRAPTGLASEIEIKAAGEQVFALAMHQVDAMFDAAPETSAYMAERLRKAMADRLRGLLVTPLEDASALVGFALAPSATDRTQ